MSEVDIEGLGQKFDLNNYLHARKQAIEICDQLASKIEVGMTEHDAFALLEEEFKEFNVDQTWHPSKIRFGTNTVKHFREKNEEGIKLKKNDIFYLDIGPVIDSHEADFGQTYTLGNNEHLDSLRDATKIIFNKCKTEWKSSKISGVELYEYASSEAYELGFNLNMKMDGHRLGDFPHSLFYKGKLSSIDFTPAENIWVLEILINDKEGIHGAFFEDILY